MFKKFLKNKEKPKPKPPGKNQPDIFLGAANEKDLIAPSSIKEVGPGDKTPDGNATDYWVEIGATSEPTRYFRSFFAILTGGSTWMGILNQLYIADFGEADLDIAIHVTPMDMTRTAWQLEQQIAQLEVEYAEEGNLAKKNTIRDQITELSERHRNIKRGNERMFMVSIEATASSTDKETFRRFCNVIVKRFAGKGVHLRTADMRQLDALLSMTPLDAKVLKDTFRSMESSNLADLFPFGQGGLRHKSGIPIGLDPQGNLILYDPWHPTNENPNIVCLGRAGAGKSFTIKLIACRLVIVSVRVGIIDPETEYESLMMGLGCPYIKLHPNSRHRINIFDVEEEEDEDGNLSVNLESTIKAVTAVVFKMIRTYEKQELSGRVKIGIQEAIRELYRHKGITEDPSSLYERGTGIRTTGVKKKMPTLTELWLEMKRQPELLEAAELLKPFTVQGGFPSQAIFDCESNVNISDVPAFAISVRGLDEEIMRPLGLFIATKWVWEKFGQNYKQKKAIITDEAQKMMYEPETALWLEEAFRTSRKRNTSMIAVTQGFEVFTKVHQGLAILKNSTTKILLKQEPLDIASVKEKFALSEGESHFLLNATKGHGIIKCNNDASVFYADATPEEYRMFTSDPNELIRLRAVR